MDAPSLTVAVLAVRPVGPAEKIDAGKTLHGTEQARHIFGTSPKISHIGDAKGVVAICAGPKATNVAGPFGTGMLEFSRVYR